MQNFSKMMKQAQELQKKMASVQEKVGDCTCEGVSGGGVVTVTMTGKGEVKSVKVDPSLLVPDDVEVLEDLLMAAFGDAKRKSEALMADEMKNLMGGMGMPPGLSLPF